MAAASFSSCSAILLVVFASFVAHAHGLPQAGKKKRTCSFQKKKKSMQKGQEAIMSTAMIHPDRLVRGTYQLVALVINTASRTD